MTQHDPIETLFFLLILEIKMVVQFLVDVISEIYKHANAYDDSDEDGIGLRFCILGLDLKFEHLRWTS